MEFPEILSQNRILIICVWEFRNNVLWDTHQNALLRHFKLGLPDILVYYTIMLILAEYAWEFQNKAFWNTL